MPTLIVESKVSLQTTKDALARAAFNLRKFAMSDFDREQAEIVESLVLHSLVGKFQPPEPEPLED